jgi:hypothetical protein
VGPRSGELERGLLADAVGRPGDEDRFHLGPSLTDAATCLTARLVRLRRSTAVKKDTMRLTLLVAAVLAVPSLADTAKLFTDKGSTYFRTDKKKALEVGAELDVVLDPKDTGKSAGKAVVMEVNGALARVNLDDDAARSGKYVVLPAPQVLARAPTAATRDDEEDGPKVPVFRGTGRKLQGRLEQNGLHFGWHNDSDDSWTQCKLVHSDQSWFDVGEVVKHSEDSVLRVKLGGAPPPPAYDHIKVTCAEGAARFYFDRPSEPKGTLKGYARNDNGTVILYNQMERAWTACDVKKPDGTHYVLGTLKGHEDDSINKGRFKKEEREDDNPPRWIEMRCKEGELKAML